MGNVLPFTSPQVHDMVQAVTKTSNHVPSPAFPLLPTDISIIIAFIDARPWIPPCVKPAIIFAFASFLRSSNLLSLSLSVWGGPHTLLCKDVLRSPSGLYILIRSSKTIKPSKPVLLEILRVPNSFLFLLRGLVMTY